MEGLELMKEGFWAGKRVLVTGATGFKGSWLCYWLTKMGAHVSGFGLAPGNLDHRPAGIPAWHDALSIRDDAEIEIVDVRNYDATEDFIHSTSPEIVFHLAAQPLVRASYGAPRETFETNILGLVYVLEACRSTDSVSSVVNVTSDKCYEPHPDGHPHVESDPMGGLDPYSASKGCAELITASYQRGLLPATTPTSRRFRLTSARAGNVIGGGDWSKDRLVPDVFRASVSNDFLTLRAPNSVRPWQHVLDALSGYLTLAEKLAGPSGEKIQTGWNFAPDGAQDWTVRAIVNEMREHAQLTGLSVREEARPSGETETPCLRLSNAAAKQELGWQPRQDTRTALRDTAAIYRAQMLDQDVIDLVNSQISRYKPWSAIP